MSDKLQLKSTEVDTKGVDVFNHLVFAGEDIDKCVNVARFIYAHSSSDYVKENIKQKTIQYLLEKCNFLNIAELGLNSETQFNIYCNRASKKLDISKDIDLFSPGGIIVLDDYGFTSCPGVKQATDDFLKTASATSFHLLTGQMIIIK